MSSDSPGFALWRSPPVPLVCTASCLLLSLANSACRRRRIQQLCSHADTVTPRTGQSSCCIAGRHLITGTMVLTEEHDALLQALKASECDDFAKFTRQHVSCDDCASSAYALCTHVVARYTG
jgi:hypothetical protein